MGSADNGPQHMKFHLQTVPNRVNPELQTCDLALATCNPTAIHR